MYEVSLLMLFLAFYSFLGWIAEVSFVLVTDHRLQNRGFLTGPFVPIYGFGAILLLLLVEPYVENPFLVFLASVVITSTLEFFTHLVLDKAFHIRLWDYSDRRFNLQGRICLQNSLLFGGLGLLLLYVIHPAFSDAVALLSPEVAIAIAWTLIGILIVDFANSVRTLAKVRPVLDQLSTTLAHAHDEVEVNVVRLDQQLAARREAFANVPKSTIERLSRAFPHARSSAKPARSPR